MSEVWEEIGSKEKAEPLNLKRYPPPKIHKHEAEEVTSKRRAKC